MQNHKKWRGGFTLVEILVVLAVVAIISSISFGAFRSVTEGNKRTNCQSNLSQIYKSVRLYSQDYDGRFPYLNVGAASNQAETPQGGIGLWSLYAYQAPLTNLCTPTDFTDYNTDLNLPPASEDGNQLAGYVRSAKIFHCPADRFDKEVQLRASPTACVTQKVPTSSQTIKVATINEPYLNPAYLSYQNRDDFGSTNPVARDTYSSFRPFSSPVQGSSVRQLTPYAVLGTTNQILDRPTRDMTVLAWCRYHRSLDNEGNTKSGARNIDNVLFSDGSVQSLPAEQDVSEKNGTPGKCYGWQRVPREKALNAMDSAANCTPLP